MCAATGSCNGPTTRNYLVVDLEFENADQAEVFHTALRGLWSRVGGELGLERPQGRILEEAESKQY